MSDKWQRIRRSPRRASIDVSELLVWAAVEREAQGAPTFKAAFYLRAILRSIEASWRTACRRPAECTVELAYDMPPRPLAATPMNQCVVDLCLQLCRELI